MTEYRKARAEEAADILDFINYVFSEAHEPHDFKKRNPAMYGGDYPFWKEHYVAVEDGRIKATLSITRREMERGGLTLTYGHVGQVSVHPYARGAGHMKKLMRMADEDMMAAGFDFSELNGLRQRYEYFGYTQGRVKYDFLATSTNTRHVLAGKECRLRYEDGVFLDEQNQAVGSLRGGELSLTEMSRAAEACEAYFRASGQNAVTLMAAPYQREAVCALAGFCEQTALRPTAQYRVYRFDRVLLAGLRMKAQAGLLPDGECRLNIEDQMFAIQCKDGQVAVEKAAEGSARRLSAMQAQELMLSPASGVLYPDMPAGWFPMTL